MIWQCLDVELRGASKLRHEMVPVSLYFPPEPYFRDKGQMECLDLTDLTETLFTVNTRISNFELLTTTPSHLTGLTCFRNIENSTLMDGRG